MVERNVAHVRRWSYALGSSLAAMAAASASPASAQCAPDPTIAWGTTNCSGTDDNGLVVVTSGTQVTVARDAIVRPATQSGSAPGAITMTGTNQILTVNGLVDGSFGGASKAGVALYAGPRSTVPCDPYAGASIGYCPPGSTQLYDPWVSADVTVAQGATVTGAQAVLIAQHPLNETGNLYIGIANSGTLTGTQGPAIVNLATGGSLSISNEATGRIDGIAGRVDYVRNEGLVDGGTGSAIAITATSSYAQITNRGSILSTGSAPTLSSTTGSALIVSNEANAVIGGNGGVAIHADGPLTLTNAGSVRGSVVSTAGAGSGSLIDTRSGTIEGDVLLGAGDDTVQALFDVENGRVSSITGRIDGGAGCQRRSKSRPWGGVKPGHRVTCPGGVA